VLSSGVSIFDIFKLIYSAASASEDFCLTGGWRYINTHIHSFIHPSDRHCSYAQNIYSSEVILRMSCSKH